LYKKEKLGLLFLSAFFVFFFLVTGTVHKDARMYPYIVCILGIALTSIQMGMTISKERRGETLNGEEAMTKTQSHYLIIALASSILYVFMASILGFFSATFFYVILFSYWHTNTQKKWMYVAVALGMDAVVYITFKILLAIPLPNGLLF